MIKGNNFGSAALAAALLGLALTGCSSSASAPAPQTQVNPLKGNLELAVGTATIFAAGNVGINVAESFRQVQGEQATGDSGAGVTTPTFTGPFTNPATAGSDDGNLTTIETGPGPTDIDTGTMSATAQTGTAATTFGLSTNGSRWGLEPFNQTSGGTPYSYQPFPVPLFDPANGTPSAPDPSAFTPWGGPPAYDPNGDGLGTRDNKGEPGGLLGTEMGLNVFEHLTPVTGTYTLALFIPGVGTKTQTANMSSVAPLGVMPPASFVPSGNGGTVTVAAFPPGVTEAVVQLEDVGPPTNASCHQGAGANPVYYSLFFSAPGTQTISGTIGPGGLQTFCTSADNTTTSSAPTDGDQVVVQTIGADYPFYESGNPANLTVSNPTITGSNGQADVTISVAALCMNPASSGPTCSDLPSVLQSIAHRRYGSNGLIPRGTHAASQKRF